MVDNILQTKTCAQCGKTRWRDDFWRRSEARDGLQARCKPCRRAEKADYRTRATAQRLIAKARDRAAERGLDFDLDQHRPQIQARADVGTCEVTGVRLDPTGGSDNPYVPSIDRIDPKRGYTYDNVRIVCYGINTAMNVWGLAPIEHMLETRRRLLEEILA